MWSLGLKTARFWMHLFALVTLLILYDWYFIRNSVFYSISIGKKSSIYNQYGYLYIYNSFYGHSIGPLNILGLSFFALSSKSIFSDRRIYENLLAMQETILIWQLAREHSRHWGHRREFLVSSVWTQRKDRFDGKGEKLPFFRSESCSTRVEDWKSKFFCRTQRPGYALLPHEWR